MASRSCFFVLLLAFASAEPEFRFIHVTDIHFDPLAQPELFNGSTFCRPPSAFANVIASSESVYGSDHASRLASASRLDSRVSQILSFKKKSTSSGISGGLFGRFGCDSPGNLVLSLATAMKGAMGHGDTPLIIVSGDWPAHHLDQSLKVKFDAIAAVATTFKKVFPGSAVISAVGNNDVFPDYNATCSSFDYLALASPDVWGTWIPKTELSTFKQMGSVAFHEIPGAPNLTVLTVNTVLYASRNPNNVAPTGLGPDPCGQFAWLRSQLDRARAEGSRVLLVGHVIPGVNSYDGSGNDYFAFNYSADYTAIVDQYSDVIDAQLFGHTHTDEFRVMWETAPIPGDSNAKHENRPQQSLIVAPSVTPIFANNPGFRVVSANPTKGYAPINYVQYYLNLLVANANGSSSAPTWAPFYNWQKEYGLIGGTNANINTAAWTRLMEALLSDSQLRDGWLSRRAVGVMSEEFIMSCAVGASDSTAFQTCFEKLVGLVGQPPL